MKRSLLGLCFILLPGVFAGLCAQDIVHPFELSWPVYQVKNSLYDRIEFIDSRAYTQSIGVIQAGLNPGEHELIVFKAPIEAQLTGLLKVLTDATAKDGVLVFQLRRFRFLESSGIRHCNLSASLYVRKGGQYFPLSQLDTVITLSSGIWKTLQSKGNSLITDFISKALLQPAGDSISYDLRGVEHIDSIEKRSVPLYTAANFTDGIYRNGMHFLRQQPDWTRMEARTKKDGTIVAISAVYPDGTKKAIAKEDIYALVYKGLPYIVTEYGFFPLQKLGDEFYSTCILQVNRNKYPCQLIIDHQTGEFIIVRELGNSQSLMAPY